jgi:hypothetical protein
MRVKELTEIKNEHKEPANENILWLHKEDELVAPVGTTLQSPVMTAKVIDIYLKESHNAIVIVMDNGQQITNGKLTEFIKKNLITVA